MLCPALLSGTFIWSRPFPSATARTPTPRSASGTSSWCSGRPADRTGSTPPRRSAASCEATIWSLIQIVARQPVGVVNPAGYHCLVRQPVNVLNVLQPDHEVDQLRRTSLPLHVVRPEFALDE